MVQAAGFPEKGVFVGRVWKPDVAGPALCVLRDGVLIDITSPEAPTMRDLLEMDDPAGYARERAAGGERLGTLEAIAAERPADTTGSARAHLLAPNDLQAVKACGVTFARSMIERVIEERAAGDPSKAAAIRERCQAIIGDSLRDLKAGSEKAEAVKRALISEGVWSQYLEVGIGPDAEVFTKAQPMSSVGHGAEIGLHPVSNWNNPEPEIVLAVDSSCRVKGRRSAMTSICAMWKGARRCFSARPRTTTLPAQSGRSSGCLTMGTAWRMCGARNSTFL